MDCFEKLYHEIRSRFATDDEAAFKNMSSSLSAVMRECKDALSNRADTSFLLRNYLLEKAKEHKIPGEYMMLSIVNHTVQIKKYSDWHDEWIVVEQFEVDDLDL